MYHCSLNYPNTDGITDGVFHPIAAELLNLEWLAENQSSPTPKLGEGQNRISVIKSKLFL